MITLKPSSPARNSLLLLIVCSFVCFLSVALHAQSTYTWTGAGDGLNWSDPDNWSVDDDVATTPPSNGDNLVFPGPTGTVTTNNDLLTSVGKLTITSSSSNRWIFTGNDLTVTNHIDFSGVAGNVTFGLNLNVNDQQRFTVLNSNKNVDVTGLLSGTGSFNVWSSSSTQGTIRFSNVNNSYEGNFTLRGARVEVIKFADAGQNSSLGAGNQITLGSTASGNSARLAYVGSGNASTNRALSVVWSGSSDGSLQRFIYNDSADNSNLSFTGTFSGNTNVYNRYLTLSGTSTGYTTLASLIGGARVGIRVADNAGIVRLTNDNTYGFETRVIDGTLWIEGNQSGATGNVIVEQAGRLGGNGVIGGATTVWGSIALGGDAIRTLTIANDVTWHGAAAGGSSDWQFRLGDEDASDRLVISGVGSDFLRGEEGEGNVFQFDFLGTGKTGEFTLVTWTGTTTFDAGDFTYTNLADGYTGMFSIQDSSLLFTVIPEPSTYMLGFGVLVLAFVVRRRVCSSGK